MSTTNNDVINESSKQDGIDTRNTIHPTIKVLEQIETDSVIECENMMEHLNMRVSTLANILNENPTTDTLKDIVKEVNNHCAALDKSHDKVIHTAQTPTDVRLENAFTETVQKLRTIETQSIQLLGVSENKQTAQIVSVANERGTKSARQSSRRSRKTKSSQCELERKVTQLQSEMADQQGEMEIQQIKDQLEQKRIKDELEQKRIKDELEQKRIKDELEQKRINDQLEQKRINDQLEQKRINDQLEQKEKQHKMKLIQRQLDRATEELSIKLSGSNCSLSTSGDNLEDYSAQATARYVYNHNNIDMSAPLHNTPVTHSPVSTDDKYIGNLNPSHSSAICNINDQPAGPRILNMQTHGTSNSDGQHSMPIQQTAANPLCKTDTYIWSHNNVDNIPSFRPQCNPTVQSSPLHAPFPPQTSADQNKSVPSQCYANATIPQYSSTIYPPPQGSSHQHDMATIAKLFADSISMNRIPVPEPIVFDGNTLDYPIWKASFETLIESKNIFPAEKIHYLKRYLRGSAKAAVEGVFLCNTESSYYRAKEILDKRYGSDFQITEAFRSKLHKWRRISSNDAKGLREYADFLEQCVSAQNQLKGLRILDDCHENILLVEKLPQWLINRWSRKVAEYEADDYPPFSIFALFVTKEADIACHPITSTIRNIDRNTNSRNNTTTRYTAERHTFSTEMSSNDHNKQTNCIYCKMTNHRIHDCKKFTSQNHSDKIEYIKGQGRCYSCLEKGHLANNCQARSECKKCHRKHPTCLHQEFIDTKRNALDTSTNRRDANTHVKNTLHTSGEDEKSEDDTKTCNEHVSLKTRTYNNQSMTSMIIPVELYHKDHPEVKTRVYAMLDTQSDATFVLESTAEKLAAPYNSTELKLTTMTSTASTQCRKFEDLFIQGIHESQSIKLPSTYSRTHFPANKSHIPTKQTAEKWRHLQSIQNEIPELLDCEIGLLIGYNCSYALKSLECLTGKDYEPFALRTPIGWCIIGGSPDADHYKPNCVSKPIALHTNSEMLNEAINNREHETFITSTRKKEQLVSMESFKSRRYVIRRNTSDILMSQTNHHMDDYQSSRTEKIKEHQEMDCYPTKELVKQHMTNRHDNQCSLLQSKRKKITRQSQKYQLMDCRTIPASWKMILIMLLILILYHTMSYGELSIVDSCTIRQYRQHCKLSWNETHPYFEEPLICIYNNSRLILNCHYIVKHPVLPPEL